jgi:hypothetical protein
VVGIPVDAPLEDPELEPEATPLEEPELEPEATPLEEPELEAEVTPLEDPELDPEATPLDDPEATPLDEPELELLAAPSADATNVEPSPASMGAKPGGGDPEQAAATQKPPLSSGMRAAEAVTFEPKCRTIFLPPGPRRT